MKITLPFRNSKRNFWFATLPLFLTQGLQAQISSFPWTETFEDNSPTRSSWSQIYESNSMSWTYASTATTGSQGITAAGGLKFANFPANTSTPDKTKLVSPPLNSSLLTSPKLSFYVINPQQNGTANWIRVYYRMSSSGTWNMMMGFQPPFSSWYLFSNISLPPNIYQIAIECENAQGYSTLIDDITISNDLLATNDLFKAKTSTQFFPNPVKDILHFTSEEKINEFSIFDISGRKQKIFNIHSNEGQIDVSSLQAGTYIISQKISRGLVTYTFIKK